MKKQRQPRRNSYERPKRPCTGRSCTRIRPAACDAGIRSSSSPAERIKELVAALEVPFDPSKIEWRVMNTTKNQQPARGQVVPYADQRAYTDRLNALFTPVGWTRKYTIHTSANFERSKDQKIAAKVLVTCELTIFGLGSHSATGEEWADDDNSCTAAEAQAFKRSCACFGLGRYLYYFTGTWVDLDDRKRPKSFLNWQDGPHPKVGKKAFGPFARVSRSHQNEQLPEMAALASTMAMRTVTGTEFSTKLRKWNTWWGNVCIADC
jgi:hypothetical protein